MSCTCAQGKCRLYRYRNYENTTTPEDQLTRDFHDYDFLYSHRISNVHLARHHLRHQRRAVLLHQLDLPLGLVDCIVDLGGSFVNVINDSLLFFDRRNEEGDFSDIRHVEVIHSRSAARHSDEFIRQVAIQDPHGEGGIQFFSIHSDAHNALSETEREVFGNEAGLTRRRFSGEENVTWLGDASLSPFAKAFLIRVISVIENEATVPDI